MIGWLVAVAVAGEPVKVVNVGTGYKRVWALDAGDAIVLVDAHDPHHEADILKRMRDARMDPEKVTAIVLTHGHPDHAGSARALSDLLDVPVVAGKLDEPYLTAGRAPLHPTGSRGWLVEPFIKKKFPPVSVDVAVVDTLDLTRYGLPGQARVVGGHTPGSLVVDLGDGDVFTGDLIRGHLFRRSVPTMHFFQDDPLRADEALRDVIAAGAKTIYPAHGAPMAASVVSEWLATRGVKHDERFAAREQRKSVAEGS
jgi:glyoxylase-like metal-dependent hydrolase (beta-lactamase superfamily II)